VRISIGSWRRDRARWRVPAAVLTAVLCAVLTGGWAIRIADRVWYLPYRSTPVLGPQGKETALPHHPRMPSKLPGEGECEYACACESLLCVRKCESVCACGCAAGECAHDGIITVVMLPSHPIKLLCERLCARDGVRARVRE
jgi:hypothetical protein